MTAPPARHHPPQYTKYDIQNTNTVGWASAHAEKTPSPPTAASSLLNPAACSGLRPKDDEHPTPVAALNTHDERRTTRTAFTLIELLVVIAIISLLMAILMPALSRARKLAVRLRCSGNLKQIHVAMTMYTDGHDQTYPAAQDPVSTSPFYWLWMGRGWRSCVDPYLGGNLDPNNPSVLFCPADKTSREEYESTSYAYSMAFYHSPQQIDAMTDKADTYSNPQPPVKQQTTNVALPSAKILIGEWLSNHQQIDTDPGWWTWDGIRNYLFTDGHIQFRKAEKILPANDNLPDANLTKKGIKGRDIEQ